MKDAAHQAMRRTLGKVAEAFAAAAASSEPSRVSQRNWLARALCTGLLLFACSESAGAIPLSVYHERVRHAVILIGAIDTTLQGEEHNRRRDEQSETDALEEMRQSLAVSETVEWPGGVLRVDNGWLTEALDAYELLPRGDAKRFEAMARIAERLQAIDERLSEIERQPGKVIDKEEEKARLAAILRRDEYRNQATEGNALARLMKRFREWLRTLFPRSKAAQPQRANRAVDNTAQIVVTLLSLAVILYVAWRFLPRFLRRELRKRKPAKKGARVVLGEKLGEDESSADLLAEAESLARAGDLRAAIRKGYIALLCELHDRKLVRLEQHKTNRDYLRAVQANRPLYEEMKPMTASFENHWYGFIPATETDWQSFRSRYTKAVTSEKNSFQ